MSPRYLTRRRIGLALVWLAACSTFALAAVCSFVEFPAHTRIAMLVADILGDVLALAGFLLAAARPVGGSEAYTRRWEARDIAPVLSLVVLAKFFAIAAPDFLAAGTMVAILQQGSVLAIVSVGLTFVLICGEIDLAVGTLALWAACFCGWLYQHWAAPLESEGAALTTQVAVTILLPLATCLALGLATGVLTIWSRLPSFIISLAMMFIAEGMAKYLTKAELQFMPPALDTLGNESLRVSASTGVFTWGTLHVRVTLPYLAMLAAAAFVLGHCVLRYSRFGRHVYATGGNREAARLSGIRTGWVVMACMAISAVAAGVGGILNAGRFTHVTLHQNKDLLLNSVAAVVLGGTSLFGGEGSIKKTLVGVLTFTVLSVGLMHIDWINDLARQLLTGVVLMAALVINGVLAKKR